MLHNVILLDDDEVALFKLKNLLSCEDYTILVEHNVENVLDICKHEIVSVIVAETHLKSITGISLSIKRSKK